MKKSVFLILNGLSMVPFLALYTHGANVGLYMFPVWLILTILNTVFSENPSQLWGYNGFMLLFSLAGIIINIYLYITFVYWDSVGGMIALLESAVTVVYILILTLVEYLIKFRIISSDAGKKENISEPEEQFKDIFL